MSNEQLVAYVRHNLRLGYIGAQLHKVRISAGYGVRTIDGVINAVLRPQELKPIEPAKP